jgi:hypothetical protein
MSDKNKQQKIRIIKSWKELINYCVVQSQCNNPVYIRWSRSVNADAHKGYSLNYSNMSREPGLSVQTIDPHIMDSWGLSDGCTDNCEIRLALLVTDYQLCGPVCSIWTGNLRSCAGGDHEDVLADPKCVAIIDIKRMYAQLDAILLRLGYTPLIRY